ncbi:MAG: hypothetical protein A3I66_01450 [Burkholderiales bacterium RIFCSPLOWO2_02_FULL_57_36]|nr:MAG: hypothetical protein A3I66_01450 [Burkholderiales bacterium RIFCSPLOWO2_02_FULL_57_36]
MWDAYKVAVRLTLVNHVSTALVAITSQLGGVNRSFIGANASATLLERKLLDIKRLGLVGGGLAAVGFGGLALMKGPLNAAKDYETAFARFKTLNLGDVVNRQANSFALGTKAFGASNKDLMETLRESVGMFGDINTAMAVAPKLAELNAANSTLFSGKIGKLDTGAVRSIMRFNDMRGLTDSKADFMRGLDLSQKMVTGSGGALKFGDLEAMAKRGGAAFKGLSDDGIMMLATIAQEQGGHSTGTALMSMYQNLIAGRTTKKTMAALAGAGLAELGSVTHGSVGGKEYKTTQITSIKGEELLRTNPGAWLMEYVVPAAKKAGAKTDSEVIKFANSLLSNRTGSNMAATFTTQQFQAMRDFEMVKGAMGVDGTINASKNTLAGREGDLRAKWQNSLNALGTTILPLAIKMVDGLSSALQTFTQFARMNPGITKAMALGFVALASAMAFGGTLLLLIAGFKGLSLAIGVMGGVGGLPMVGAALTALLGPVGLVVLALGTLLAAAYAFRPMSQGEIDGHKTDGGVKLTPDALARSKAMGWNLPEWKPPENSTGFGPKVSLKENPHGYYARQRPDYVPPPVKEAAGGKQGDVFLDGQKVGQIVSKHQEKAMARPPSGMSVFDPSMNMRALGSGFSGL